MGERLIVLSVLDRSSIKPLTSGGLYLLQSDTEPTLFRLGETKNLSSRQGTHGGSAPRTQWKKAPNWSEVYRPWRLVWAASAPTATHLALKMCEHHLHAVIAREYCFVDESGFRATADATSHLIRLLSDQADELVAIIERQREPKFDKHAHYAQHWPHRT